MNIVGIFLGNEIRTGGHVRYLELMEGLAARGNRVAVLLNSRLGYEPRGFEPLAYPVKYRRRSFPPASWIFRAEAARRAGELLASFGRPDAVLVFGETHLAAGRALARKLGAPLVYGHRSNTVREILTYLDEKGTPRVGRLRLRAELLKARLDEARIGALADLAVFQSEFDRKEFLARVPAAAGRTAVVRGDISGPRFRADYANANRSETLRTICFMGALGRRKGVGYFVESIVELARRGHKGLRFRIYGSGPGREALETRLREGGAEGMAVFLGKVADPFAATADADLLVVPSLFDSYPNTVLEALHVGTPVIGSAVGGIPDMLASEELLFPPMDAVAIADRIERCVAEPGFYARLRSLCAERRDYFRFDWAGAWEGAIAGARRAGAAPRERASGERA